MKERKGFIVERDVRLYVRISYTDNLGKRRELMRRAQDRKHARELKKQLVKQLDSAEGNQRAELDAQKLTFAKVADRYEATKLIPAQYVNDRKVAGLRSLRGPKAYLRRLVEHFGNARLRSITYSQVDEYRLTLLAEGLSITSANRILATLRSVFNFAKREGWLTKTPFEMGEPLIRKADETRRTRVMSREEETKLLAVCMDKRARLRPLVIAAVDTGARFGELKTLQWADVDLPGRTISIRAFHTKTAQGRTIPISERLFIELTRLYSEASDKDTGLVFGIVDNVKRSWKAACRDAEIKGLKFHDLRGTFVSRMIEAGMPAEEVAKITGHSQIQTLYAHYLRITNQTIGKAAELLNQMHDSSRDTSFDVKSDNSELIN